MQVNKGLLAVGGVAVVGGLVLYMATRKKEYLYDEGAGEELWEARQVWGSGSQHKADTYLFLSTTGWAGRGWVTSMPVDLAPWRGLQVEWECIGSPGAWSDFSVLTEKEPTDPAARLALFEMKGPFSHRTSSLSIADLKQPLYISLYASTAMSGEWTELRIYSVRLTT